jgi:hypothetical protein
MSTLNDFINFDYFITKDVISLIYFLGAILITIIGIIIMIWGQFLPGGIFNSNNLFTAIFTGLLIITLGNLFWRILCEFIAVIFKINESLISIDASLESEDED